MIANLYIPMVLPVPSVSYGELATVYPEYTPIKLEYNQKDLTSQAMTSSLMDSLL